jgi:drug/metabolite transporter (DMT)-like permease
MFWEHEVPVNTAKTASAGAAVAGAVLLFTNPPVGLIVGISAGVAGLATSAGDSIATKVKRSRLGYKISEVNSAARELEEVKDQI